MAFRTSSCWRTMLKRFKVGSATFATGTSPKGTAYAPTADFVQVQQSHKPVAAVKGDSVPVYVAVGMIALSATLGLYTGMHHLLYDPAVYVRKRRRETLPEVYEPDDVVEKAEKFIETSFFRKVAHVQELDHHDNVVAHPIRGDVLAHRPLRAETLKEVGVDPKAP
ncbi:hypothetical protein L1049_027871 [Liquidambar formosana]|uniref:Uncharacterized protein n=1 Tax=Liquidambar formosana TaxID=63359 RepID=A0AAP0WVM4_LIQFO